MADEQFSNQIAIPLEEAVHSQSAEVLERAAGDPSLSEDLALALLKRLDLPASVFEALNKNAALMKLRKVKVGLVSHPKTPRHLSLPLLRQLYTFDLMSVALTPVVPANVTARPLISVLSSAPLDSAMYCPDCPLKARLFSVLPVICAVLPLIASPVAPPVIELPEPTVSVPPLLRMPVVKPLIGVPVTPAAALAPSMSMPIVPPVIEPPEMEIVPFPI